MHAVSGRFGSSLAVAAVICAGVVGVQPIGSAVASTPRAAVAHISARPESQMVNSSIKLIGTHFKSGATLTIEECSQKTWIVPQDPCDTSNAIVVRTKGGGRFSSSFTVQTCPGTATSPPGFSQGCYIGDPTPSGIDVIELVGAAAITVTGP